MILRGFFFGLEVAVTKMMLMQSVPTKFLDCNFMLNITVLFAASVLFE